MVYFFEALSYVPFGFVAIMIFLAIREIGLRLKKRTGFLVP